MIGRLPYWAVLAMLLGGAAVAAAPAGSSAGDVTENTPAEDLSVDEILTTPSTGTEGYAESPRCIAPHRIRDVHVLDDAHVVFEMRRDKFYLALFNIRCPMLEPRATIFYDATDQLCRLDSIRPLLGISSAARVGPPCQIAGFKEINRSQFLLLRESLKDQRRRPDLVDKTDADKPSEQAAENVPEQDPD